MPLQVTIARIENGRESEPVMVQPICVDTPPGSFRDYSHEEPKVISAVCMPGDSESQVFEFAGKDFLASPDFRIVPVEMYEESSRVATLTHGQSFEHLITLKSNQLGKLVLTHVDPRAN